MRLKFVPAALAILVALAAPAAYAQSAGTWSFGIGAHKGQPKSDNGKLVNNTLEVEAGSEIQPTITGEYFIAGNLGIEFLASWPFTHDVKMPALGGQVARVTHLSPTLSLQYHFNAAGKVRPFVGAGLSYSVFYDEKTSGALRGNTLSLDDSWGIAVHGGTDFAVGENSAIRIDARWIDMDSKVKLNGARIGTTHLDPIVYGAAYVINF